VRHNLHTKETKFKIKWMTKGIYLRDERCSICTLVRTARLRLLPISRDIGLRRRASVVAWARNLLDDCKAHVFKRQPKIRY
jgi:hypothetical protein